MRNAGRVQLLLEQEDLEYTTTKHTEADIPTFVDARLCEVPEIFFNAGSRRDVVGMRVADYVFAARPMLGQFCLHPGAEREGV